MPEYQPLFHQVQNFIADQLNSDPQLSSIGLEFLPESQLDIEYEIKRNLGRQGMVGIVNTLKGTYGGHDQDSCAWEIESEIDVVENPTVRRAWLKQNNLSAGTTVDVLNYIQESLCGPASPTYGKFCPVTQEVGEDNGVLVGKAVLKTFAISDVSACVSGESNWHIRYATEADISALWDAVYDVSAELSGSQLVWDAIAELSGDIDNLEYNFEWAKEQIQDVIPQELSTKISYPVIVDNPYGASEWKLDISPLDNSLPASARVVLGSYLDSDNTTWIPYISLGDSNGTTIRIDNTNHLRLGTNSRASTLVNFNDLSAAISALDIDHFIRWFATPSQPNRWIVNFGRSSTGGISFVSDSDHPTQSYIDIAGNIITAPGYDPNFQSRGLMRSAPQTAGEDEEHLQFNQKGLAFVEEVSSVQAEVSAVSQDIQDLSAETPSIWRVWDYQPAVQGLAFTAEEANSTVRMFKTGTPPDVSLEYTTNGRTWTDFIVGETTVTLANVGDKMWLRAKTTNSAMATDGSNHNYFAIIGKVAASGSIMYLLKNDGDLDTISENNCFYGLFYNCLDLTEAPDLPATTVTRGCYNQMFAGCMSLRTAPTILPATTLDSYSYYSMFNGCSSLTQSPEISATTLGNRCMGGMFNGCTSLKSIKIAYTGNFDSKTFVNWVLHVPNTGTFYYNGSDTTRGTSAIPEGWTVQTF